MSKAKTQENVSVENIYKLDGRVPVSKAIPFGLQHVLAMFVANLAPVVLVLGVAVIGPEKRAFTAVETAQVLQSAMFAAGVATTVQLYPIWKIGAKLPIVMGCSFTFLAAMQTIASTQGYETLVGAIIVGGCIEGTLGLTAKYWRKYVGPVVSASVVMAIGLSLLAVGMDSFGGSKYNPEFGSPLNLCVAMVTLLTCLIYKRVVKGVWRNIDVLVGLGVGYVLSVILTVTGISPLVDFSAFSETIEQLGWINIPLPVFMRGITPVFDVGAIASMTIVFLVSAAETIGGTAAVAMDGLGREVTEREVQGSLGVDGFGSAFSGLFGACPVTSFNQNIGLIAMTGVVNRFTILMGSLILILASLFPPIGAFFNTIPDPVLGGCMILMYGSIVFSGVKMIAACGDTERNMTIVSLAFCIGVGVTQLGSYVADGVAVQYSIFNYFPSMFAQVFNGNAVAGVFVVSLLLDLILPGRNEKAEN